MYTVSEDAGTVEVCAIVLPSGSCPIQFAFDISLATNSDETSKSLSKQLALGGLHGSLDWLLMSVHYF